VTDSPGQTDPIDPRRRLPSVDALLADPAIGALAAGHPRALVLRAVRTAVEAARANGGTAPATGWSAAVRAQLERLSAPSLVPVINATGVVLHTNLGRALLAPAAVATMTAVARSFTNVEYDLGRGARGSRHAICRDLLTELTGAEDAVVVNNAAAGLLLALSALARDGEAIVSRGELVEIGGAFRVPDIMARSGARLVEVGTTNRTHLDDYVKAITPRTRALLKVHRSNFRLTGFTAEVAANELAQLARASGAASVYDLGSGLLLDLTPWGLTGEPTLRDAVASGVDVVVASGDKLLGGPQAGLVVGKAAAIAACKTDPLARAVRPDKFTLAALEATLALYRDPETARREIPTLRMLTEDLAEIRRRGEAIIETVEKKGVEKRGVEKSTSVQLIDGFSEVGGGSFPETTLKTWLVQLTADSLTADGLVERLRGGDPAIIARIEDSHVVLDPRTILPDQIEAVARGVTTALGG
jgi:L-seryl-tRNA(Ser) seleniumtransferase